MANGSDVVYEVVFNHLPKIIAGMDAKAERIVKKAALDIQANAQAKAPVDTGTLRASIQAKKIGDKHWEVWVGVDYGIHLEYGTRFMAAQPYMRPAVQMVRSSFIQAMKKVALP